MTLRDVNFSQWESRTPDRPWVSYLVGNPRWVNKTGMMWGRESVFILSPEVKQWAYQASLVQAGLDYRKRFVALWLISTPIFWDTMIYSLPPWKNWTLVKPLLFAITFTRINPCCFELVSDRSESNRAMLKVILIKPWVNTNSSDINWAQSRTTKGGSRFLIVNLGVPRTCSC